MENRRSYMSKIVGVVFSGIVGLLPASDMKDINVIQQPTVIVSAAESERINVSDKEFKESNSEPKTKNEIKSKKKRSQQFYRTKTGKCYHRGNCYCLRNSKIKVNCEEIENADLRPCKICFK